MIRADNFIFFLTASGFFVGLIFTLLANFEPLMMIYVCVAITFIFYMIALAASGFFVRYSDVKTAYKLGSEYYETQLDKARAQIEKREIYIRDSIGFIRSLEKETNALKNEESV
ncbi:MAG: hypothetical protein LBO72_00750 [Helicobacteraceae bacterium]|jgi:hypothetical protein|nr:hypothetical protein [Helicobacteraceae bacterium]